MTVRKLISELKKMPQNLQIYYSHQDNSEWEIAGDVCSVDLCVKEDLRKEVQLQFQIDINAFETNPTKWVIIRG